MPVAILNKLPKHAKEIWESTYSAAKAKYGPERAAQIAWSAVKKSYKKKGDNWVKRAIDTITVTSETPVLRSEGGELAKEYFVEGYIASTEPQPRDGLQLTKEFFNHVIENQFKKESISLKGDIEHVRDKIEEGRKVDLSKVPTDEDVLRLVDYRVDDINGTSKLWAKFKVDRTVNNFEQILYRLKNKFYDSFSSSFRINKNDKEAVRRELNGMTKVYKGRLVRATLTGAPVDRSSVITAFYEQ